MRHEFELSLGFGFKKGGATVARQQGKMVGIFAVVLMLGFTACTKSKELKSTVSPDTYSAKADIDGKIFSLVRGIEDADGGNGAGAIPGFSSDYGYVKARVTEEELQFIEVFNPARAKQTQSIIAAFKIKDHFDIQREVNDFGETTNKVIENREKPWRNRAFMRVNWAAPVNKEAQLAAATMNANATVEGITLLEDTKIENGDISWLTEFSVVAPTQYGRAMSSSRVTVRTHLLPVKQTDFERVNYRNRDFDRFGIFRTEHDVSDLEKGRTEEDLDANRFANLQNVCEPGRRRADGTPHSCSTNKIVWFVNKNFPARYREVTRQVVREWNDLFKQALDRKDDVVVLDESREVDTVDPRVNVIAYYGEKARGGLLGVAQRVSNPETGEAIAVRATVFEDGIRSTMGQVDNIISLIVSDEKVRNTFLATDAEARARMEKIFLKVGSFKTQDQVKNPGSGGGTTAAQIAAIAARRRQAASQAVLGFDQIKSLKGAWQESPDRSLFSIGKVMSNLPGVFANSEVSSKRPLRMSLDQRQAVDGYLASLEPSERAEVEARRLPSLYGIGSLYETGLQANAESHRRKLGADHGVHGAELVSDAAVRYLQKILAKYPNLKDFQSQVQKAKEDIAILTFYTTLAHEMGHTFGLRHNFMASADSRHYHPEFNRLIKQLTAEINLPPQQRTVDVADLQPYMFSSIMDYGGEFYAQKGGLGPYDLAAIRYAYNRSIDKTKDPVVSQAYGFCTDDEVGENILCRQFDLGRNASEITLNLIERYQNNWVLSHTQHGRADFSESAREYPINALRRYFIPIRQVMDELLYSLITATKVAAKEGECDIDFWRTSTDRGEIVNLCNRPLAEQSGVDPLDFGSYERGLFAANGELRRTPVGYAPMGLADLLFANMLAKEFFQDVLGSTEPGLYVAIPQDQEGKTFNLERVGEPGQDLDKALTEFAAERGLPPTPQFLGLLKGLAGEVKLGRYGKPLNSIWDETGREPKQLTIGSFWDKYVAMIALGARDIGVDKYRRRSMNGNAHVYPQTREFAVDLSRALILQNERIATVPFKAANGTILAHVAPALSLDLKGLATMTALTSYVSDTDRTIADKLRVCSQDDQGCLPSFDRKVVEFTSASGHDKFRAPQTDDDASIAVAMVEEAAELDKQRTEWVGKRKKADDTMTDALMKRELLEPLRLRLKESLESLEIPVLKQPIAALTSDATAPNGMLVPSAWNLVRMVVTNADKIPFFNLLELIKQANGLLGAIDGMVTQTVESLDPGDTCKLKTAPKPEGSEVEIVKPLAGPVPAAVVGLNEMVRRQTPQQAPTAVPPTVVPAPGAAIDCAVVKDKRERFLKVVGSDLVPYAKGLGAVLEAAATTKVAPIRIKQLTSELQSAEATIRLVRSVSKGTGLQ